MQKLAALIGIIAMLCLLSCGTAPPAYISNKMHVPLFDKQGQIYAEGSLFGSPTTTDIASFDGALGYTPFDHLMVAGTINRKPAENSISRTSANYYEIDAGYFTKLKERGVLEVIGSFGHGKIESQGYNTLGRPLTILNFSGFAQSFIDTFMVVNSNYNRYSIEAHLGASSVLPSRRNANIVYLEAAISARISYLHFNKLYQERDYSRYGPSNDTASIPSRISTGTGHEIFPELSLMARIHFSSFALELQWGLTTAGYDLFYAYPYFITAGLIFRL